MTKGLLRLSCLPEGDEEDEGDEEELSDVGTKVPEAETIVGLERFGLWAFTWFTFTLVSSHLRVARSSGAWRGSSHSLLVF